MKTKFIAFLLFLLSFLTLFACSDDKSVSNPQKGWDLYCQVGADYLGVDVDEYKVTLQRNLTLQYVYLEETDTVYYKGTYGSRSTFYFMFLVGENYATDNDDSLAYTYALDLYNDGYAGYAGTLDLNKNVNSNVTYEVKFYNGNELLYTTTVKEGYTAYYQGATPTNSSVSEGCVVTEYEFAGWNSDLEGIYNNKSVYATFNSIDNFSSEYDSISRKQDVINFLNSNGKTFSVSFDYNGSFVSSEEVRYELSDSDAYFAYVSSHDLFVIADGTVPVCVFFEYQNFNSTAFGFGLNYGKYADITYAYVNNHKLTGCNPSGMKSSLAYAVYDVNKFLANRGYGYLTD